MTPKSLHDLEPTYFSSLAPYLSPPCSLCSHSFFLQFLDQPSSFPSKGVFTCYSLCLEHLSPHPDLSLSLSFWYVLPAPFHLFISQFNYYLIRGDFHDYTQFPFVYFLHSNYHNLKLPAILLTGIYQLGICLAASKKKKPKLWTYQIGVYFSMDLTNRGLI